MLVVAGFIGPDCFGARTNPVRTRGVRDPSDCSLFKFCLDFHLVQVSLSAPIYPVWVESRAVAGNADADVA